MAYIDKYNFSAIPNFEFNASKYTADNVVNEILTSPDNLENPSDFGTYILILLWAFFFWLFTSKYFGFKIDQTRAGMWASAITLSFGIIMFVLPVGYLRSYRPLVILAFLWLGFVIANRQQKVADE